MDKSSRVKAKLCGNGCGFIRDTQNFRSAILATSAIPMVMSGIQDVPGAPSGMYRDGGLIDVHVLIDEEFYI